MIIIGIIVAILIFSLVIIIHEFGHFFMARNFGVKVLEFGLGIPPKAKKIFTDKSGTNYTLNWLPLGGFVKLNGEENIKNRDLLDKTKFYNKNYLQKSLILLGGVFMNFLLASIIFSILFFIGIKPIGINSVITTNLNSKILPTYKQAISEGILIEDSGLIVNPIEGSIAKKSGILKGDIIIEVNNIEIKSPEKLINILKKNKNKKIKLKIKSLSNEIKIIHLILDKNGKIGAYIGNNIKINKEYQIKFGIVNSIKYGIYETYIQSVLTLKGIGILGQKIFSPKTKKERAEALNQMSGPIGIVDFVSHSLGAGIIFLSIITAIISINLGIFNLLPIPALDGGRFFLLTINTIFKKLFGNKIKLDNFENLLHIIFFIALIALSLLIGYNDIEKIINR